MHADTDALVHRIYFTVTTRVHLMFLRKTLVSLGTPVKKKPQKRHCLETWKPIGKKVAIVYMIG